MKKKIALCFALLCFALPALAEEKSELKNYYPSLQELYDDCKKAVEGTTVNSKTFIMSYCYGRITGMAEGIYYSSPYPPVSKGKTANKVESESPKTDCFDVNSFSSNLPWQYSVAKDFIAYVDELKSGPTDIPSEKFMISRSPLTLAGFFQKKYSCKKL